MYKIKPGRLTAGTVKSNFKGTVEGLLQGTMHFHSRVQSREHPHTGNSFYMMHQLWLSNKGYLRIISDEELRNSSNQERCNLLNNKPVLRLVLGILSIELKYFSKKSYLMVLWGKQNIMLFVLNSQKGVAHMSIHLCGFSTHQILKMKLSTQSLLRK